MTMNREPIKKTFSVAPLKECPLRSRLIDQIMGLVPWDEKPLPKLVSRERVRGLNWRSGGGFYKQRSGG